MNRPMPRPWPAHADDLDEVLAEAFRLLARGVADRRSAFHTPTVATIGADGAPSLRTMVLRGFDAATRTLRFHTDLRAAKIGEAAANPHAAVLIYDAAAQIQVRLSGHLETHRDDDTAVAGWTASRPHSRLCYGVTLAPGTEIPAPLAAPDATTLDSGYANFGVLLFQFDGLEWLWLAAAGHRRARCRWRADGAASATWLAP